MYLLVLFRFKILASSFKKNCINTTKFFYMNELEENDEVSEKVFLEILSQYLSVEP